LSTFLGGYKFLHTAAILLFSPAALAPTLSIIDVSRTECGLYLQALCTGLDQVLEPYRKTLLALEQEASMT
jgi:hypothetical protein